MTDPNQHVTDEEIVTWLVGGLDPDREDVLLTKFDKDPSVPVRIERIRKVDGLFRVRTRPEPIPERDRPGAARVARLDGLLESLENGADDEPEVCAPGTTPPHVRPVADDETEPGASTEASWRDRRDGSTPDGPA